MAVPGCALIIAFNPGATAIGNYRHTQLCTANSLGMGGSYHLLSRHLMQIIDWGVGGAHSNQYGLAANGKGNSHSNFDVLYLTLPLGIECNGLAVMDRPVETEFPGSRQGSMSVTRFTSMVHLSFH